MQAGTWSDKDVEALRVMLANGMRAADIARQMHTTYYRVKDKIKTLKDARKLEQRNVQRARDVMKGYVRRAAPDVEMVERRCLCCGDRFQAEGRYLRLCPAHRGQS